MENNSINDMRRDARFSEAERTLIDHANRLGSLEKMIEKISVQQDSFYLKMVGDLDNKGFITEFKEMCEKVNSILNERKEQKKIRVDWARWIERSAIAGLLAFLYDKLHNISLIVNKGN